MTTTFYAVDRFEGKWAVIVSDDGKTMDIERARLPKGAREGTVLRVRMGPAGPNWSSAEIDREEEERRRKEARQLLDEMKRSDPGGDISL